MATTVKAFPAKRFFVEMLTRDIELVDAILDLLDNCIDGALRTGTKPQASLPYTGYSAHIELSPTSFKITDNCGGIPRELAENYAFRFGRADAGRDSTLATVGVYGIGMKRAIFKIGTDCLIESKTNNDNYSVHINKEWIDNDDEWEIPISDTATALSNSGTSITINELHPLINQTFEFTDFIQAFGSSLKKHYSLIIENGFEITINGQKVIPEKIKTLIDIDALTSKNAIAPFIYKTDWDGITISLVMGLYEKLPTDKEQDESEKGERNKDSAGWTIICNDRVVVTADKTRLTGWGEAGVPAYHSQFIALAGVVTFNCNNAIKLPVTTTKRGIDQNSKIYGDVKEVMREALKHFTSFTNKWKSQSPERDIIQSKAAPTEFREAITHIPRDKWTSVRNGIKGEKFVPHLPIPLEDKKIRRIQFNRDIDEIAELAEYLLSDRTAQPAEVGNAAFTWVLKKARS